jgi:hypothetical protein
MTPRATGAPLFTIGLLRKQIHGGAPFQFRPFRMNRKMEGHEGNLSYETKFKILF